MELIYYVKRAIASITIIVFTLGIRPASVSGGPQSVEIDGIHYYLYSSPYTASVACGGSSYEQNTYKGELSIPSEVEFNSTKYKVTAIHYDAFRNCTELHKVELPSTITHIADRAFYGSSIQSFVLPDSVNGVSEDCFRECKYLERITIGENVTSIGKNAFYGCENLKSVYISSLEHWMGIKFHKITTGLSSHVSTIWFMSNPLENGADLYINGMLMENLVIPKEISNVNPYAFYGCTSIKNLTLPDYVTYIGDGAFDKCLNLTTISIYGHVGFGHQIFGVPSLESLYIYGSVSNSFTNAKNLTKVRLSTSMVTQDVVYGDESLSKRFPYVKEFIMPEEITRIGSGVFGSCDSLQYIDIPSSVKSIGKGAFANCSSLHRVNITDMASWCNIQFGYGQLIDDVGANPLSNKADLFLNGEKVVSCILPDTVAAISGNAFYGCTSIESVVIPESVNKISEYAFSNCPNLSFFKYPSNPLILSPDMFYDCPLLVSAGPYNSGCSIEYGWKQSIPDYAFCDVPNLRKIIIPSTITSIGNNTFRKQYWGELPISEIYVNSNFPPIVTSATFSKYDATLYVPGGTSQLYAAADYWKKFKIVELVYIENLKFEKHKYDLVVGDSIQLSVVISPYNATYQEIYWQSSDPDVATVDNKGIIRCLKTGNTTICATTTDGTEISAKCEIRVTNPVSSVILDHSSLSLEVGQTSSLVATCSPEDADDRTISWSSDDIKIARIENGMVTGVSLGKTLIRACSVNGKEATCEVTIMPTLVTSLSIPKQSINLHPGVNCQLSATILPENATNKQIAWSSDDERIASVNDKGMVTAIANGMTFIRARACDGTLFDDSCSVSVTTQAQSIEINKENCDMVVGEGVQLTATVLPLTTSNKTITWKSSNETVAMVSASGYVTGKSTGRATITATTIDGTNLEATSFVSVTNPVISISLNKEKASIKVGETITLTASCTPINADDVSVSWHSSDTSVASVENGVVTGKALGKAVITANSANGKEAKCEITVIPTPVKSILLNENSLNMSANSSYQLFAAINPTDATNKVLSWKSSNEKVAVVSVDGIVAAHSTGTTTITVSSTDGTDVSASCIISVTTPVTSISINPHHIELMLDEQATLSAKCTPQNADNKNVTWKSSDADIAMVSADGTVTAKKAGETTITATTVDGSSLSSECQVVVKKHPQSITWDQDLSSLRYGGELLELFATSSSSLPIVFTSSDENVATIFDMNGVIYLNPASPGVTQITALQSGDHYFEAVSVTKEAKVIDPSGDEKIWANNGKYIVTSINGIRIGVFSEEEYHNFTHNGNKGLYIVNGIKISMK